MRLYLILRNKNRVCLETGGFAARRLQDFVTGLSWRWMRLCDMDIKEAQMVVLQYLTALRTPADIAITLRLSDCEIKPNSFKSEPISKVNASGYPSLQGFRVYILHEILVSKPENFWKRLQCRGVDTSVFEFFLNYHKHFVTKHMFKSNLYLITYYLKIIHKWWLHFPVFFINSILIC